MLSWRLETWELHSLKRRACQGIRRATQWIIQGVKVTTVRWLWHEFAGKGAIEDRFWNVRVFPRDQSVLP